MHGVAVGKFAPRDFRRGGTLLGTHELALRPTSTLREQYALSEGDRELARVEGRAGANDPCV